MKAENKNNNGHVLVLLELSFEEAEELSQDLGRQIKEDGIANEFMDQLDQALWGQNK